MKPGMSWINRNAAVFNTRKHLLTAEKSQKEKKRKQKIEFLVVSAKYSISFFPSWSLSLSLNLYLIDWYDNSDLFILISMVSEREAKSNVWNKEIFFFEKRNKEMYMCVCIYIYIYGTVATISPIQRSNRAANNIHKVGIFDSWRRRWWWWLANEYLRALLWTSQMYFDDFLNFRI